MTTKVEQILRTDDGEYSFEEEDGEFGVPYGTRLLKETFPETYRVKGMSCFYVPTLGTVVVTCRTIHRIRKPAKNGRIPMLAPYQFGG